MGKSTMDGGKPNHNLAGCHQSIIFLKFWKILTTLCKTHSQIKRTTFAFPVLKQLSVIINLFIFVFPFFTHLLSMSPYQKKKKNHNHHNPKIMVYGCKLFVSMTRRYFSVIFHLPLWIQVLEFLIEHGRIVTVLLDVEKC